MAHNRVASICRECNQYPGRTIRHAFRSTHSHEHSAFLMQTVGGKRLIECNISRARFNGRISSVRCVNIPVLELGDHKKMCAALIEESIASIQQDKTLAIVLGCTGMINVTEEVQAGLNKAGYNPLIQVRIRNVKTIFTRTLPRKVLK